MLIPHVPSCLAIILAYVCIILQEMFADELKKHSTPVTYIEQNLSAQDNILKALTEANAAYADTRKMHADVTKK